MVKEQSEDSPTTAASTRAELKGSGVDDPIYSRLRGYHETRELVSAVQFLYGEIQGIDTHLFPYSIYDSDAPKFTIEYIGDRAIHDTLTEHIVNDQILHRGYRAGLYPDFALVSFLHDIAKQLLINGVVFYAIDWGNLPAQYGKLSVPVTFRYLRTSTMQRHIDKIGKQTFIQRYNPLVAPPNHPHLRGAMFTFESEEILYVAYTLGEAPVHVAADLARKDWAIYQQLTLKAGAATDPEDMRIEVEQSRHLSNKELWRTHYLNRAKIRAIFSLPYEDIYRPSRLLEVSDIYQAQRLVDYLRYMVKLRQLLLDAFNQQVMLRIATLNTLPATPYLKYEGAHATELEIQLNHSAFRAGDMTYEKLKEVLGRGRL